MYTHTLYMNMSIQGIEAEVGVPAVEYDYFSEVLLLRHQSTSSLITAIDDQVSEAEFDLPLDSAPEYLPVSSSASWVAQQSTELGGTGTMTMANTTTQQRTGCIPSRSFSSNPASPTLATSPSSSATPMSQLLVSGTRSKSCASYSIAASSSSSSSLGHGSMTFGPDEFMELFRSRVMSEARGERTLQRLKQQRLRSRVCLFSDSGSSSSSSNICIGRSTEVQYACENTVKHLQILYTLIRGVG